MTGLSEFGGRNVVITGASSGIGRLLALRLAGRGARLALLARRRDELASLVAEIEGGGGEALAVVCDLGDDRQSAAAIGQIRSWAPRIDLLVNNAGYGAHRPFLETSPEEAERMMRVNFGGSYTMTHGLLPGMIEGGQGWIVFVSSVAGRIGVPGESAYVATKFALTGLAEALSIEVEDAGVHVLTVYPGAIRTPFFTDEDLERMPPVARRTMVEPGPLVDAILDALARGRRELTWPRSIGLAYPVRAVAPEFFRGQVKRKTRGGR